MFRSLTQHLYLADGGEASPPAGKVEPMEDACVVCGALWKEGVHQKKAIKKTDSDRALFLFFF